MKDGSFPQLSIEFESATTTVKASSPPNFREDAIWDELQARLDLAKSESTNTLDVLEGELRNVERGYLARTSDFLSKARTAVAAIRPRTQPISYDPALRFLLAAKANLEVSQVIDDLRRCSGDAERHTRLLSDLLAVADGKATTLPNTTNSRRSWFQRFRRKQKS
jgi:hypothetical protein